MITKTASFSTTDNQIFASLEQAQQHEIELLLGFTDETIPSTVAGISNAIMDRRDKLVDILTTTASSKPRARKVNGGSKKRKPDPAAVNRELQDGKQ